MTTSNAENGTPGTLKFALVLWMVLIGALLGYSIATADEKAEPAAESHEGEGAASHAPEASTSGSASPHASVASPAASAAGSVTAAPAAAAWTSCTAAPGVTVAYPTGVLEPAGTDCSKLAQPGTGEAHEAVMFQIENKDFTAKMAELRAEKNPDAQGELKVRNAAGYPAGVMTYKRDASTYVSCPGASIEYVYYVEAPKKKTLVAVSFACEAQAEAMHKTHDEILSHLKFA